VDAGGLLARRCGRGGFYEKANMETILHSQRNPFYSKYFINLFLVEI